MEQYSICGLRVEADLRYEEMRKRAAPYRSAFDGPPDITVPYRQRIIEDYMKKAPGTTASESEIITTTPFFYARMLEHSGFLLHSSAVVMDGFAYLFSADSGTGKSTHTGLWLSLFGDRAYILNDDKPAVRLIGDTFFACGTPWSGKNDLSRNELVPVRGICMLERSPRNRIERMTSAEAFPCLMRQTLRPPLESSMDRLLELTDILLRRVPLWKMGCNISEDAAQMSFEAMSG